MALLSGEDGFVINLYANGTARSTTPCGEKIEFITKTDYPADGRVKITLKIESKESFKLYFRNPDWSKKTRLCVNGEDIEVTSGYIVCERVWKNGDEIVLDLDMRTRVIHPIPYGNQIIMNKPLWGINYMVSSYDEEDPLAKKHIALYRGPIVLAQENRFGYSVDEPADIDYDGALR